MGPSQPAASDAPPGATPALAEEVRAPERLRARAVRASIYEVAGFGTAQVLRLGSNLVLTRLLFPEAFGAIALVNILNYGLFMMSDVGIEPAVIQNKRGDELPFLNTAWTIQVVRGVLLYAVALALSWPIAVFYRDPQLTAVLAIGSLGVLITGFHSTSLYTLRRRVEVGRLTLIEIAAQVLSIAVMLPWALLRPSVWALVAGSLVFAGARVVASYLVDVGYRNRFGIEPAAKQAIRDFGKWIFAASAVYFVSRQGDRILFGRWLGVAELGVYSIAVMLAEAVTTVITRVTHGVLFPVLSRVREAGEERLREVYARARLAMDAVGLPAIGVLTVLAPWIIHLLYDRRYAEAGWMLQALSLRLAMTAVLTPSETCLFALGHTRYGLYQNVARLASLLTVIPLGWYFFGIRGLVYATAISELPIFFVLWPPLIRNRVFRLAQEVRAVGLYGAGLVLGLALTYVLPPR